MKTELKTPGLRIEWLELSARLYAKVFHVKSRMIIRSFNAPIEGGKRKFVATVDEAVKDIDWTRSAKVISKDEKARAAIWAIVNRQPYSC